MTQSNTRYADNNGAAMTDATRTRAIVDKNSLPIGFPTHRLPAAFWEELGRVVGTFGALEEVLGKAIFALTGTRQYAESEAPQALAAWERTLQHALTDTLRPLIDSFEKAVRGHPDATIQNVDDLLVALRKATPLRNALCHGSWQVPDADGRSQPLFVDRHLAVFDTAVDVPFLQQTQRHVAELVVEVINVVTHMGIQFPGSDGPGKSVW